MGSVAPWNVESSWSRDPSLCSLNWQVESSPLSRQRRPLSLLLAYMTSTLLSITDTTFYIMSHNLEFSGVASCLDSGLNLGRKQWFPLLMAQFSLCSVTDGTNFLIKVCLPSFSTDVEFFVSNY